MEEEKKSRLEQLEGELNEATTKAANAKTAWEEQKKGLAGAYRTMLTDIQPQIDNTKVDNTRKMGKVQAWTDFLSALTSGVIGAASKGYAPQVGANAQPYAVSLENMRELNKQRIENYNKLKAQTDIALAENDLRYAQSEYERALAEEKEANKAVQRQQEIEQGEKHEEKMLDKRIEASQTGTQKPSQMDTIDLGGVKVVLPEGFKVRDAYYNIIRNGVKGVTQKVKGDLGDFKEEDVDAPTDTQMWAWVYQHPEEVLAYLKGEKPQLKTTTQNSQPKTTTQELPYETATPTGGYFTPNYNKDKEEQEKSNNSSFYAPNGFTYFEWQ